MSDIGKTYRAEIEYLIGDLSQDEMSRMEEEFFADDSKFEALELVEDELIDNYVQNELSAELRRQFQAKLLQSAPLMERVKFARVLAEKADSYSEAEGSVEPLPSTSSLAAKPRVRWWGRFLAPQPGWGMALTACALLVLIAGVVLVAGWLRLRNETGKLAAERAAQQRQKEELDRKAVEQGTKTDQLAADLQRAREQQAKDRQLIEQLQRNQGPETPAPSILGAVTSILLTSGSMRSGGGNSELALGASTSTARLKLTLENDDYRSYNATVKTGEGNVVHRQNGLKPHKSRSGPLLILSVPSRRLPSGDYLVYVDGVTASGLIESVNNYPFRVKTE